MARLWCFAEPRFLSFASLFLATVLAANAANAAQLVLSWDPNSENDIAGYRIHYGTTSDYYPFVVDVGNVTSCVVSGLSVGQTYYFAASAYDTEGLESELSKELPVKIGNVCGCDLNDDGACNIFDWSSFMADWSRSECKDPDSDCDCDISGDGVCNIVDWSSFMVDWGRSDCTETFVACGCDINGDGSCNLLDFQIFTQDWGRKDCNQPGTECECDLNEDGSCNLLDWQLFIEASGC